MCSTIHTAHAHTPDFSEEKKFSTLCFSDVKKKIFASRSKAAEFFQVFHYGLDVEMNILL